MFSSVASWLSELSIHIFTIKNIVDIHWNRVSSRLEKMSRAQVNTGPNYTCQNNPSYIDFSLPQLYQYIYFSCGHVVHIPEGTFPLILMILVHFFLFVFI